MQAGWFGNEPPQMSPPGPNPGLVEPCKQESSLLCSETVRALKGPEALKNADGHANAEPLIQLPRGSAFACALRLMRSTAPVFPGADAFACSLIFW